MQTIPLRVEENGGTIPLGLEPVRVVNAVSPTAVVERVSDGVVLTVHDLNGTTTAEVYDGEKGDPGGKGDPGAPGADGVSPTVSVEDITGGHRVAITDATGEHSFDVMNGAPGEVPIDDNAGIGDTTKVWSADKSATEASQLSSAITASATEETAQEMLSAILSETGLTESALAVIGMTFDALPSDETAQEIRDAIKLEADRLNDIFDLWLAEKESA